MQQTATEAVFSYPHFPQKLTGYFRAKFDRLFLHENRQVVFERKLTGCFCAKTDRLFLRKI